VNGGLAFHGQGCDVGIGHQRGAQHACLTEALKDGQMPRARLHDLHDGLL
jgi:hypothetical protein